MPYLSALALTLCVEVPLYSVALVALARVRPGRALTAAVLVNLLTHPALWWFLAQHSDGQRAAGTASASYPLILSASEVAVWLVEGLALRYGLGLRDTLPYALALTANCASLLVGLLVAA